MTPNNNIQTFEILPKDIETLQNASAAADAYAAGVKQAVDATKRLFIQEFIRRFQEAKNDANQQLPGHTGDAAAAQPTGSTGDAAPNRADGGEHAATSHGPNGHA